MAERNHGCDSRPHQAGRRRRGAICQQPGRPARASRRRTGATNPTSPMNFDNYSLTRRDFMRHTALAATAVALGVTGGGATAEPSRRNPVAGFTKPFQQLPPEQMADLVAEIGWDGIECPVRAKGQIEPGRVGDELPRLV